MSAVPVPAPQGHIEAELAAAARDCRAIAQRLAELTVASFPTRPMFKGSIAAAQVRRYLRARRLRAELLPAELFADPAWDMMLDLYASEIEGKHVSVSSACIASAVPATTGLRWLGRLEELGMIVREPDPGDSRRCYVRLTTQSREGIERWLQQAPWLVAAQYGLI